MCITAMFAVVFAAGVLSAQPAGSPEFFELKIRPILADRCYDCHTTASMSGLRLDSRESVLRGGWHGPAVKPGDPEHSLLIQAVRQTGQFKMPVGGKLTADQIQALVDWVKAGAEWPSAPAAPSNAVAADRKHFWSFLPLKEVAPPAVRSVHWPKAPIDRFILARLEKEGMQPVRPATKRDLIRRATLDLTGLPPTPEEVEAFEKDAAPDAFAKVVDRLLASPHYGERWGRLWLDVARYGEDDYRSLNPFPKGYFPYANAWLYRDWVVQAFNDDLPYDQFVKAQLAGDLLDPKIRYKMLPATGFLGLGPWYFDNGAVEVTRADERHDRVDVVTRGFLGLTAACARCHDHKYDPIPTTDYYSLAGVFLNTTYHEYPRVPQSVVAGFEKTKHELEEKEKVLGEMQQQLSTQLAEALAVQTSKYLEAVWEVAGPRKKDKAIVVEERKLDYELLDRWIRYMDRTTDKYKYKDSWQAMMKKANASPPPEAGAPAPGPRPLVPAEVRRLADEFQADVVRVMIARREMNDENDIITAKALEGTVKKKRANKPNEFVTNDDFCPGCGLQLKSLPDEDTRFWTEIFQRELRESDDPNAMINSDRAPTPGVLFFRGWALEHRVGANAQAQINTMQADVAALKKKVDQGFAFLHGVQDAEKPVNLRVSLRGSPYNLGPEIPRHFLSVLSDGNPEPFQQGSGRLELAEDIVRQPLATRVIVNRVWKWHFGSGIVDTPSNFGMSGERPTNPDLLEYLAAEFQKSGLSLKKLHRQIMLSAVYQLSADNNEANYAKDSGNRLYWRFNRTRLDAEQLRDSILTVAGNLDDSLGGPSSELTPGFKRRTIYGRVSRYKLDQYLQTFDFPSPNISAEKRYTTTVPLQRLFLMNSDFVQLESEELARRVAAEPDNRSRIRKVYLLAYGREPSEREIQLGLDYLHTEPMREYTELKDKPQDPGMSSPVSDASDTPDSAAAEVPATPMVMMGMGMMGGVPGMSGAGRAAREPAPVKYNPTPWGRYVKILLSSSEFLFIN